MSAEEVFDGIWLAGGPEMTDPSDCCVYLIQFAKELALIDAGAGGSVSHIMENVESLQLDPKLVRKLILTHCHIDHIGGANEFKSRLGCEIIAQEKTAEILLRGDPVLTAAKWYGMEPPVITVDQTFADSLDLAFGNETLHLIHLPGHSPDSSAAYLDRKGKRILFGQDVHGPLHPALGSNADLYHKSLQRLIELKPDILCEGHFGIYQPNAAVERYIKNYLG